MPEPSTTILARLISMVRIIDAQPGISVTELAQFFGRPEKRIRADIDLLDNAGIGDLLPGRTFEIDYDLYTEQGLLTLRSPLNLSAPLPITEREFARLVTALQAMAPTLSDTEQQILPQTLSTLLAARSRMHAGTADGDSLASLTPAISEATREKVATVQKALTDGKVVVFDYVNGAGRHSHRTASPSALVLERDGWVMTGYCHTAESERTFRLDRTTNLSEAQAALMSAVDATSSSQGREPGETVKVTLHSGAAWALRESPAATVEEGPAGRLSATYQVWDPTWMRTELLALAPYVEDVSPHHYLEETAVYARQALEETLQGEDTGNA